jgi:hypothetical protein
MKEQKSPSTSIVPAFIGKDEMNLAEYPFSLLTHRIPPNRKTYSLTQHIIDSQGRTVKQTWAVLGSDKYGLPTPYDDDVILALLYCYNSILKFFQVDSRGMFRMTSSARYFKKGVGSSRPN